MKRSIAIAWMLGMALSVVGCSRGISDAPRPGGRLVLALADSLPDLDPATAWDPAATPFLRLLYEGLVAFDDSGQVVPACAERWTVTANGRIYRFELREGLQYADGRAVEAADFRRGFERLFAPGSLRSPGAAEFAVLEHAFVQGRPGAPPLGIETPDERTLILRLAWRDPGFLEKLAQPRYAIPRPSQPGGASGSAGRNAVPSAAPPANGPYQLLSSGSGLARFVRNPHYRKGGSEGRDGRERGSGGPYLDTILVRTSVPARRALLGLESGRVDVLWPIPRAYEERLVRGGRHVSVRRALDPPIVWYLCLNAELAPTARRDARRAVALAVNRQRLPEILGPGIIPWRGFAPSGEGEGAPGYDPLSAQQFLQTAHFGRGIRLPISVPRATALADAASGLAPSMARASIQPEAVPVPIALWEGNAVSRRGAIALVLRWQSSTRDPLDGLAALLLNRGLGSGWGGNFSWFRSPGSLDSLLVQGLRETDPVARRGAVEGIESLLAAELPLVPLARVDEWAVHREEIAGLAFHPRYGLDLRTAWRRSQASAP